MRRKTFLAATALSAGAVALSACGPGSSSGSQGQSDGGDVTLTVWSWRTEDEEAYNRIFDVYEEANPGVTIELQTFKNSEYTQVLTTGLTGTSSAGPDIVQVQAYNRIQPFIDGGNLVAIDDTVDGIDGIEPAAIEAVQGREDGKTYGVPFASQMLQMFYNKAIFAELGLGVPKTWSEFLAVNETLQGADYTPLAIGAKDAWTLPIVHSVLGTTAFGGDEFGVAVESGEKTFEDPAFVESIDLFVQLQDYMPTDATAVSYTDAQTLFISGQAGMFPGGSFEIAFFRSQNPDLELGVFPVPPVDGSSMDEGVITAYQDGGFAINAASDKQDAAADLLSWMATSEFGQLFTDELSQPSPIEGVEVNDELLSEIVDLYTENPQKYLLYTDFRWGAPASTEVFNPEVQSLLLGQTDAEAVASEIEEGVSTWLKPSS